MLKYCSPGWLPTYLSILRQWHRTHPIPSCYTKMHFQLVISLLAFATVGIAAYPRGPVSLSPKAVLSWDVDFAIDEISFALVVTDTELNESTDAWVGIGVGESTSGGMLGADIFTAEFASGVLDNCTVKDRHVPFVPYPLTQAPGAFPVEDSCQTDGSWTINSCVRNLQNGTITLDVKRPLMAVSPQDRNVSAGDQVMMYAYGGSTFMYHENKRGGARVVLFNADETFPAEAAPTLPDDVAANFSVIATNYSVPPGTMYACTAALIPVPAGQKWYMVAARPVLKAAKGRNMAHHFVAYLCPDRNTTRQFFETRDCDSVENDNPTFGCSIIYVWAVGASDLILPEDVGFLIESSNSMLVLQTHFDNPENSIGVDTSGTQLFFSTNRSIHAGSLVLGDFGVSLGGLPVKNQFNYTSTCPSNCTSKWPDPEINVFASALHMHTTGRNMWTNKYNPDGSFNESINSIEYWSNDHQYMRAFDPPKKMRRGDVLSTTCNYDTSKKPGTLFGYRTIDEMCIDFVFYYPVQHFGPFNSSIIYCGMLFMRQFNYTGSFCGSEGFNFERNPSFNDSVGLPSSFGSAPKTCPVVKASPNTSTATAAPTGEAVVEPSSSPEGESVCFPGSALVRTLTRGVIEMKELRINDEVYIGSGLYSPVFMFTHRIAQGDFEFIQLTTSSGESLRLTAGHHLYSNGRLVPARDVRVGDVLIAGYEDEDIASRKNVVVAISKIVDTGLYNPQTLHGNIAVNDIITSTYTESISPSVAHAVLAPLRFVKQLFGLGLCIIESDDSSIVRHARRFLSA